MPSAKTQSSQQHTINRSGFNALIHSYYSCSISSCFNCYIIQSWRCKLTCRTELQTDCVDKGFTVWNIIILKKVSITAAFMLQFMFQRCCEIISHVLIFRYVVLFVCRLEAKVYETTLIQLEVLILCQQWSVPLQSENTMTVS